MKILYQIPSLNSLNAGRTIYYGYKHAFEDSGHEFKPYTLQDKPELFDEYQPDIYICGFSPLSFKFTNFKVLNRHKKRGMKVLVSIPFWNSPISRFRLNETPSISQNNEYVKLIKSGRYGDIYFNVCEQGDKRMEGFEKSTGYKHHTVMLAADKTMLYPEYTKSYKADVSYIGTNLSEKRKFFKTHVFPLKKNYNVKLYGQDWTVTDRLLGTLQKVGQYYKIPFLQSIRKPKLQLDDERRIYSSSLISINIHEDYQKRFGGDCNERTFKIPACGGFEISDDVACIKNYFKVDKEIIIAYNRDDWFDKINYFIRNPDKRIPIIEAGRRRVLKDHTYHNRVKQLVRLIDDLK